MLHPIGLTAQSSESCRATPLCAADWRDVARDRALASERRIRRRAVLIQCARTKASCSCAGCGTLLMPGSAGRPGHQVPRVDHRSRPAPRRRSSAPAPQTGPSAGRASAPARRAISAPAHRRAYARCHRQLGPPSLRYAVHVRSRHVERAVHQAERRSSEPRDNTTAATNANTPPVHRQVDPERRRRTPIGRRRPRRHQARGVYGNTGRR